MKKCPKIVSLVIILVMALTAPVSAAIPLLGGYQAWPGGTRTIDDVQYDWNIKFNDLLPDEVNKLTTNIFVTDADNKLINTSISLSDDGKTITIAPLGTNPYQPGCEYRLYIKSGLMNRGASKNLNKAIVMPFMVKTTGHIVKADASTNSILGSRLTTFTLQTSPSVYYAKIDGTSMEYKGNNTFGLSMIGLAAGKTVNIQVYDNQNRLLGSQPCIVP